LADETGVDTMLFRWNKNFRKPGRVSKCRRPNLEFLEDRITPVASLIDIAETGVPNFPIPAGSTLIATSDSGKQILFSSLDTNVVAGQQSLPTVENLYWMDISQSVSAPTIRLVTHFAGSTVQATGYIGVGNGLVIPFEPQSASLSGDGQYVVFDSRINAHSYDATVPAENDQPDTPFNQGLYQQWIFDQGINLGDTTEAYISSHDTGTPDVFVWSANAADPANNITTVSLLNSKGKAEALVTPPYGPWNPGSLPPDPTKPMAIGVFGQIQFQVYINPLNPQNSINNNTSWANWYQSEAATRNCGISDNGNKVLYSSQIPAPWIDQLNTSIKDTVYPEVSPDGFLVTGTTLVGAANLQSGGLAQTATIDLNKNALGFYDPQFIYTYGPFGPQTIPGQVFEPQFLHLSGDGNRVVYSTRQTSTNLVAGTTDSDFSLDVIAFDVSSGKNLLISRKSNQPLVAAGSGQPNYTPFTNIEFYDSQNLAVSDNGQSIAFSSSAANLVNGWTNNNVELLERITVTRVTENPTTLGFYFIGQHAPIDLYTFKTNEQKTWLINTPNGVSNTNLLATFGGMSNDGNTYLFGTAANNFYSTPFSNPPYPPFGTGPLPPNFLLGGFSNLWARNVNLGTSTLISVSANNKSSGNQATLADPVNPEVAASLPNISDSGRYILFSSKSNNLVTGIYDPGFVGGTFLRDMTTGVTRLISTVAGGNVPSAALITGSALSTDDTQPTVTITLGGTLGKDMQTRFRPEEVPPGPHIYTTTYPQMTPPASNSNSNIVAVTTPGAGNVVVYEYRGTTRTTKSMPNPFPGYYAELRVATGDVNADGIADYLFATGPGVKTATRIIDGRSFATIGRYQPFPNFYGGAFVALGDINNDGYADPVFGAGETGGPHVVAYSGKNGSILKSFYAYNTGFLGGVRIAAGDVNNDGYADIIVAPGQGGGPHVLAYSGLNNKILLNFLATSKSYTGGLQIASSDLNSDGYSDIITAPDTGNIVSMFSGAQNGQLLANYNAGPQFAGGTRLSAREGSILLASGPGVQSVVRIVAFRGLIELSNFSPFGTANKKGQFIG